MAKSKLLIVALVTSLAVNLAIVGFVGAQWLKHGGKPGPQIGLTFDRHAAFAVLDEKKKKQVKEIWRQHRPDIRSNFLEYRHAKRLLSSLLTAEELDKDAIEAAHEAMLNERNEIEKILNMTLIETAEILPPEKRELFFKTGFQRWQSRHHGGWKSRHQDGNKERRHE